VRRFLVDRIEEERGFCIVSGPEARHMIRVLRLAPGDRVTLVDREGRRFEGAVHSRGPEGVRVDLIRPLPQPPPSPVYITLCQAVLKSRAMDFVVQKACELGVDRIIPVVTERSVPKMDDRGRSRKVKRWREIAAAAVKQSDRARPPVIEAPLSFQAVLGLEGETRDTLKVMLWERERRCDLKALFRGSGHMPSFTGLVGPEGGFSEREAAEAEAAGYTLVSLGRRILRAETAGTVLVALAQYEWGDLHVPGTAVDRGSA